MVKPLNFTGLMAPVFTCFSNNREKTVRTDKINEYAEYLKLLGIRGVLVNGTTGEGPCMNVNERKIVTEAWIVACKRHQLTLMVQVGGASMPDVMELTRHAAHWDVDAVLCLPELYFKPKTITKLVSYLGQIASLCPDIPFLYYHIPMMTGIAFNMPGFCDKAEQCIPNFVGIKYTSSDLDQGVDCLKPNRHVFLGADTILLGAVALGFNSAIMTTLNICPKYSIEIMKYIEEGKLLEAKRSQLSLNSEIQFILHDGGGDWVSSMKKQFNDSQSLLSAGAVRFIKN